MKQHKVSVCIPAFESPEYLIRAINSVLNQDYSNYEVIVTDDSRTEDTYRALLQNGLIDKIKYTRNPFQMGSPLNWNKCISLSSGYYIKILHQDDWLSTSKALTTYVETLEANNVDIVFSAINNVDYLTDKTTLHQLSNKKINSIFSNPYILYCGNLLGQPSTILYKASLSVEFDPLLKWLVDIEFYIKILVEGKGFYISAPLVFGNKGDPSQITNACVNNKKIQVYEFVYLYQKINKALNTKTLSKCNNVLLKIFARFGIKNELQLEEIGCNELMISSVNGLLKKCWRFTLLFKLKKIIWFK